MKKILFCNLDLLVKGFARWNPEIALTKRNEFLEYISILCEDNNNVVCFISRDKNKLNSGKEHFDKRGYNKFKYKLSLFLSLLIKQTTLLLSSQRKLIYSKNSFLFVSAISGFHPANPFTNKSKLHNNIFFNKVTPFPFDLYYLYSSTKQCMLLRLEIHLLN